MHGAPRQVALPNVGGLSVIPWTTFTERACRLQAFEACKYQSDVGYSLLGLNC